MIQWHMKSNLGVFSHAKENALQSTLLKSVFEYFVIGPEHAFYEPRPGNR